MIFQELESMLKSNFELVTEGNRNGLIKISLQ